MVKDVTDASYSDWTAVRSALVADVLRKNATSPQLVRLRVYGESMLPALWPGDFVEIESCSLEDVGPGEIVLALREGRLFLHRLLTPCTLDGFTLRGDSLPHSDPQFPREALLGRQVGRNEVRRNEVRRAHRAGSVTTSAMPLGIRPTLSRAIGLFLCHCAPARRIALKLHSLGRAWARELGDPQACPEHSSSSLTPLEPRAT